MNKVGSLTKSDGRFTYSNDKTENTTDMEFELKFMGILDRTKKNFNGANSFKKMNNSSTLKKSNKSSEYIDGRRSATDLFNLSIINKSRSEKIQNFVEKQIIELSNTKNTNPRSELILKRKYVEEIEEYIEVNSLDPNNLTKTDVYSLLLCLGYVENEDTMNITWNALPTHSNEYCNFSALRQFILQVMYPEDSIINQEVFSILRFNKIYHRNTQKKDLEQEEYSFQPTLVSKISDTLNYGETVIERTQKHINRKKEFIENSRKVILRNEEKECTFKPEIMQRDVALIKYQGEEDIFQHLYMDHVAIEKKLKTERERRQNYIDPECTFKPKIYTTPKIDKLNSKVNYDDMVNRMSRAREKREEKKKLLENLEKYGSVRGPIIKK